MLDNAKELFSLTLHISQNLPAEPEKFRNYKWLFTYLKNRPDKINGTRSDNGSSAKPRRNFNSFKREFLICSQVSVPRISLTLAFSRQLLFWKTLSRFQVFRAKASLFMLHARALAVSVALMKNNRLNFSKIIYLHKLEGDGSGYVFSVGPMNPFERNLRPWCASVRTVWTNDEKADVLNVR